jgi:hypothetical protein
VGRKVKDSRAAKLLSETVEASAFSVEVGADVFERWTISLWRYRHPVLPEREEICHWHTSDLEDGLKCALIAKQKLLEDS